MKKTTVLLLLVLLSTWICAETSERTRVDTTATIESFKTFNNFCTINYQGDYQDIMNYLDDVYLGTQSPGIDQLGCSLYTGIGDETNIFLGRNFDNPQQDALVGKYSADGCYQSVAVNRLSDLGLYVGTDFESLSHYQSLQLLKAPYFSTDGINETGLAVGIAYVEAVPVDVDPTKDTIFITRWIREILDHAATIEDAITITNSYNILDNLEGGPNSLCHHILVADASGNSAILEYHDGAFEAIYPDVNWQVLTNTHVYNHTLQQMFNLCYRYELLYDALEAQGGSIIDWRNGLDILELPTWGSVTNGTQWSNVFDCNENYMYLSLFRDFNNIVRVDVETFDFVNYGNIYMDELVILDADGDGYIEPNEEVSVMIFNSVDFNSYGVTAELTCDDPNVSFANAVSNFGDILPEVGGNNVSEPFYFTISSNPEESIEFTVTYTTDYGYSTESSFYMQIAETNSDESIIDNEDLKLQNYPNPFNPTTTISFDLFDENIASHHLDIFNVKGQLIRRFSNDEFDQSTDSRSLKCSVIWDGSDQNGNDVPSGIYFYTLNGSHSKRTKKMMLLK